VRTGDSAPCWDCHKAAVLLMKRLLTILYPPGSIGDLDDLAIRLY
jgi:hypothetical protein